MAESSKHPVPPLLMPKQVCDNFESLKTVLDSQVLRVFLYEM